MSIGKEIFSLQEKIGYFFSDVKYLENALTHSSYSNEQKSKGIILEANERLEFLGDAILQFVISEYLYVNYKKYKEGTLTRMRQFLVCEKTLAKIATEIELGNYINLGKGEETNDCRTRPKVIADALEALFAAIYLDSVASKKEDYKDIILSLFETELARLTGSFEGDYKTILQQLVEKDGLSELKYEVVSETGPEHNKKFSVVAKINNNIVGQGEAKNKKDAEMQAAKLALKLFGVM